MMEPAELARWIHEEHDRVEDMTQRLRQLVAAVPRIKREEWIVQLRGDFEHLRAHLVKHMALEERDGYFACVRQLRPALDAEVARLEHEHRELGQLMDGIQVALQQLTKDDLLLVRDVCARVTQLLNYVGHHEKDEQLLATYAFTQDIGTKD
jgi:hemerythrin-like domain-containing protein